MSDKKPTKKDKIDYDQLPLPKTKKSTGSIDYSQLADPKPTGKKKRGRKADE